MKNNNKPALSAAIEVEPLSKEEEINLIDRLIFGKGYFAEYFVRDHFVMCQNIQKDFPIEMDTTFDEPRQKLEQVTEHLRQEVEIVESLNKKMEELERENARLSERLFLALTYLIWEGEDQRVTEHLFTGDEILANKVRTGYRLNEADRNRLMELSGLKTTF